MLSFFVALIVFKIYPPEKIVNFVKQSLINFSRVNVKFYLFLLSQIVPQVATLTKGTVTTGQDHFLTKQHVEKNWYTNFCIPTSIGLASRRFDVTYVLFHEIGNIS